jgi:hypothetical protein
MGIYVCVSLTAKETIVKSAQRHKHKISANTQKQNKNNVAENAIYNKSHNNNNNNNNNKILNSFFLFNQR